MPNSIKLCLLLFLGEACRNSSGVTSIAKGLTANPATLDFGTTPVGSTVSRTTKLSNSGGASLLVEIKIDGVQKSLFTTKVATATIGAGASLEVSVVYLATTEGSHQARLLVHSAPELTIDLLGNAKADCSQTGCHSPAGSCFEAQGTCTAGVCSYQPKAAGTACDDGDVCTKGDVCTNGACAGTRQSDCRPASCNWPCVVSADGTSCVADVGAHICGGTCVLNSSPLSCGSSCTPCPGADDGSAVCSNQTCTVMCSDTRKPLTGIIAVSAGATSTCAVTSAGGVKCWGWPGDNWGQGRLLGSPMSTPQSMPVDVPAVTDAVSVSVGKSHACALTSTGSVWCWGGVAGIPLLGDGTRSARSGPVLVSGLGNNALSLSAGASHTCVVTRAHTVKCWGDNNGGELGNGTIGGSSAAPLDVVNLTDAVSVSTSLDGPFSATCAVTQSGAAKCWGGWKPGATAPAPEDVAGLTSGVISVSPSGGVVDGCALMSPGSVSCWGPFGPPPSTATGLPSDIVSMALGGYDQTGCVRTASGTVSCFNFSGGQASGVSAISGISGASQLSCGSTHCCVVVAGQVKCWGFDQYGQLGDGRPAAKPLPVPLKIAASANAAQVAIRSDGGCLVTKAGAVQCWGESNTSGQLGDGTTQNRVGLIDVKGLSAGVTHLASAETSTCAVTSTGVVCWGEGPLGNGIHNSSVPVAVSGLSSGVQSICAQEYDTSTGYCAVDAAGAVQCWGSNFGGQLGDGTTVDRTTPVVATGLTSGYSAVSCRYQATCALSHSGTAKCWGPAWNTTKTPTDVAGLTGVTAISSLPGAVLVALNDGSVKLVNASLNPQGFPPITLRGTAPGVVSLAGGCLLTIGGEVQCRKGPGSGVANLDGSEQDVADVYGFHSGATFITAGHNDTTCIVDQRGAIDCFGRYYDPFLNDQFGGCSNSRSPSEPVNVVVP